MVAAGTEITATHFGKVASHFRLAEDNLTQVAGNLETAEANLEKVAGHLEKKVNSLQKVDANPEKTKTFFPVRHSIPGGSAMLHPGLLMLSSFRVQIQLTLLHWVSSGKIAMSLLGGYIAESAKCLNFAEL